MIEKLMLNKVHIKIHWWNGRNATSALRPPNGISLRVKNKTAARGRTQHSATSLLIQNHTFYL